MGNNASIPEKVFVAVQKNDVTRFQKLVAGFGSVGQPIDPAAKDRVLEYKDKYGRTPLIVAASKNHYQILQQLLSFGANIHYVNPARDSLGSALHEAAAKRHEAAVELLLASGANPFAANASGRTALDVAVMSGHTGVVRAIEKRAEFTGMVAFKTRAMGGLSYKFKARWAVLMPYYTFQREGAGAGEGNDPRRRRRCLWLYKNNASNSPRCRMWVDGATVLTHGPAGTEGTLRLHTSHGEPVGDLCTSYSKGYCVQMRPADLTPAAVSTYQQLVNLLGGTNPTTPTPPTPQRTSLGPPATPTASSITTPAPATPAAPYTPSVVPPPPPYPPPPPPPPAGVVPTPASYPQGVPLPPMYSGGGISPSFPSPSAAPAHPVSPYAYPPSPYAYPGAAVPIPMASPLTLFQESRRQAAASTAAAPWPDQPATGAVWVQAVPDARRSEQQPQQQPPRGPVPGGGGGGAVAAAEAKDDQVVGTGGMVIDGPFIERMSALPGESDEAFAARLASAISATSGRSQQHLYPRPQPATPTSQSRAAAPSAAAAAAAARQNLAGAAPPLINFQSDPGSRPSSEDGRAAVPPAGRPPGAPQHQQQRSPAGTGDGRGARDELDMTTVNALIGAQAAAAASAPNGGGGSGGMAASWVSSASKDEPPSAPPAPGFTDPRAQQQHHELEAEAECVICLSAPKEVGFLHGDSVHRCVCRSCASHVPAGAPCPLCRQTVERVLGVY